MGQKKLTPLDTMTIGIAKGHAAPAVESLEPSLPIVDPPAIPLGHRVKGATIAITVRLDEATYRRLKGYGIKNGMTNQAIMVDALNAFLPDS